MQTNIDALADAATPDDGTYATAIRVLNNLANGITQISTRMPARNCIPAS
ncbi:hypothetical protein [Mycobacterium syngnathidarum]